MQPRTWILAAALALLAVTSPARAASSFVIDWHTYNYPNSCVTPNLTPNGGAFFEVNQMPIPTWENGVTMGALGSFHADYRAPFAGALLKSGQNDFLFSYEVLGLPACVATDETVRLRGPMTDRLLFQLTGVGNQYEGVNTIGLTLREIDPNLADSLENLRRAIRDTAAQLAALGIEGDAMSDYLDALEQELNELIDLGFDEITPEMLDALLAQFDGLPASVRDALVDYLSDLQTNIAELRAEIDRIAAVFQQRVDNVDGVGDGAPGFDPTDAGGFDPIEDGDVPPISIPEVLGEDPWTPQSDPYAQYADEVLATIGATVSGNLVTQRATFLAIHGAWLYNIRALEMILQQRSTVTVAEWGAFLTAKGRVLAFVERFIDRDGWMRDAPVSPELRALVAFWKDLDIAYRFKKRAEALQLEINLWTGALTERQRALLDIMLLWDQMIRERMAQQAPAETEDGFWDIVGNVVDTAISFTPIGDFLDLCAAVTGREGCVTGRSLTLEERALSALGAVVGSAAVWKAAAGKVSAAAAGTIRKVGDVLDEVPIRRPHANITQVIDHVGGAKTYVHASGWRVRYDRRGFADFSPYKYTGTAGKAEVRITYTGGRNADFTAANLAAGFTDGTPIGYTWHHHHDVGKMILVRTDVHANFAHTGGVALYQKMHNVTYGS